MNGRIYDPLLGRFLSGDPFIAEATFLQSYNRYSYVHNNPLSMTDPSGYLPKWLDGFLSRYFGFGGSGQEAAYEEELEDNNIDSSYVDDEIPQQLTPLVDVATDAFVWGVLDNTAVVVGYVQASGEQVLLGEFSDEVTILGTGTQVLTGLVGVDLPADIRDTIASAIHFAEDPSFANGGMIVLNLGAMLPVVGVLKYGDEVLVVADPARKAGGELPVGGDELVTVYRGVHPKHPDLPNAFQGKANPIGGHADPILHNGGDNRSIFTSWTTNYNTAFDFAVGKYSGFDEAGGVILRQDVPRSSLVKSPDDFDEFEVLRSGPIEGASPIIISK